MIRAQGCFGSALGLFPTSLRCSSCPALLECRSLVESNGYETGVRSPALLSDTQRPKFVVPDEVRPLLTKRASATLELLHSRGVTVQAILSDLRQDVNPLRVSRTPVSLLIAFDLRIARIYSPRNLIDALGEKGWGVDGIRGEVSMVNSIMKGIDAWR